jgi:hypothetical protein
MFPTEEEMKSIIWSRTVIYPHHLHKKLEDLVETIQGDDTDNCYKLSILAGVIRSFYNLGIARGKQAALNNIRKVIEGDH